MEDDARLVAAARSGDLEAFAELVRRHELRVRSVLHRLLDDPRDVEEAAQDTFVQAWRNLDRFAGRSQLFTWLYRIAANEAMMRRRRKRHPEVELDEAAERVAPSPPPHVEAEGEELRRFLDEVLRALPFEYRAPIVLRDVEGLSNQEVADVLGLTVEAAKSRIHRARLRVRAALDDRLSE